VEVEPVTRPHRPDPLVDAPSRGRIFSIERRPLLGDCAPTGRVRLDALARWLQDVAFCDVEQAGVELAALWVLRRTRIRVTRFPRFGERCEVRTFCSGLGRMWAERRTTVLPAGGGAPGVEAVALWVHLDPARRLPSPLTEAELAVFSESAGDRRVLARLRHPRPEQVETERRWDFRRTDADVADHINNAAYWEPLEDELLARDGELAEVDAEVEFRTPAQPGPARILAGDGRRWIAAPDADEPYASIVLMNARTTPGSN
jgi:acyl-ACP thioesterase